MTAQNEHIIGYSGFDVLEECYGYNEDACYMADSEASAQFLRRTAIRRFDETLVTRFVGISVVQMIQYGLSVQLARLRQNTNASPLLDPGAPR